MLKSASGHDLSLLKEMFGLRNIRFMIVAVSLAMIGLVITQVFWITDAVKLKDEEFARNVNSALYESVDEYHKNRKAKISIKPAGIQKVRIAPKHSLNVFDSLVIGESGDTTLIKVLDYKIKGANDVPVYSKCCFLSDDIDVDSVQNCMLAEGEEFCKMKMNENTFSNQIEIKPNNKNTGPFVHKLDFLFFDSLFTKNLHYHGITLDYLMVAGYEGEELEMFRDAESKASASFIQDNDHVFSATVIEANIRMPALKTFVLFPNHHFVLIGDMWWLLVASGLLILVLIISFYYSIRTILKQKKESEIKTDFINNMTHELKTPISTIGLACEMLSDNSISTTDNQRKNYVAMIRDENKRLGTLVESVLQTAVIDRGELTLKPEVIEVSELIQEVATNFEIQVMKRNGTLSLKLNAAHDLIYGDKVHLSNVIFNLLDNANKYSFDTPEISIFTGNTSDKIIISVTDKGVGINKDDQKKIFEKLYRIPTGNVHNVKGFGLGLSYVKAVIEKHLGAVDVDSDPGKGSTFTISLPLYHGKES